MIRVCCGLVVDDFLYGSACFSVGECPFGDACASYGAVCEIIINCVDGVVVVG